MTVSSSTHDTTTTTRRRTIAEIDVALTRLGPHLVDPAAGPLRRQALTRAIDALLDERTDAQAGVSGAGTDC